MTIKSINGVLRAAVFGGAAVLLSPVAFAGEIVLENPVVPTQVPDHAQAQAGSGAAINVPTVEKVDVPPDHATAEARGPAANIAPMTERIAGIPDHATAEARGLVEK